MMMMMMMMMIMMNYFSRMVDRRKAFTPYLQPGPLSEILTIANLRHGASKVWNCAESEFRLCWTKLCSIDNLNKLDKTIFWKSLSKEMCAKNLKFFGSPTTEWRPCKIFAKFVNHLLIANIFKLHKYQTFDLMKIHNTSKIGFASNKFRLCKSLVYDWRAVENVIFNLCLFPVSKFQIVKNLLMNFEGSYEVLLRQKKFWSSHFWLLNGNPFNIFWSLRGNAFCFFISSKWKKYFSLFLLNERDIRTSPLMIHLKCTAVHYANLNWSSINKTFLI